MHLKTLIFSITAVAAFAQDEPVDQAPKPTLADVRHLAEAITSDKSKLRAYCELGGIHDQMQQALDIKMRTRSMRSSPSLTPSSKRSAPSITGDRRARAD
jgi:hypothetical protein